MQRRRVILIPSHKIGGPMMGLTEYGPMGDTDGYPMGDADQYRLRSFIRRREAETEALALWEREEVRRFGRPIVVEVDGARLITEGGNT